MNRQESAILRTILYADVFKFAMTLDEITRYLISPEAIPREKISYLLDTSPILKTLFHFEASYICLANHPEYIQLRCEREKQASRVWLEAQRYGRWLANIPFVRMVAITGALAMRNPANYDDDFDYVLVTKSGRVWMARGFAVLLVRLVRLFGRELCPNYVLAEDRMVQKDENLYMAHEIVQMQPISGQQTYHAMLADNAWTAQMLANACPLDCVDTVNNWLKRLTEWVLGGWFGDKIEAWEYQRKSKRFRPKITPAQSNATIDSAEVKGHFDDHGYPALAAYQSRLVAYGLAEYDIAQAGD